MMKMVINRAIAHCAEVHFAELERFLLCTSSSIKRAPEQHVAPLAVSALQHAPFENIFIA